MNQARFGATELHSATMVEVHALAFALLVRIAVERQVTLTDILDGQLNTTFR